jgi:hypothetical protein
VVATILDTGCRIDELLDAKVNAFDLQNLLITVRGKGDKERKVPFSFELRKTLFCFLQRRESANITSPLMFCSLSGVKWNQRNALRAYYALLAHLGVAKSGFHRLRHTFATEYLRAGGDVVRLSSPCRRTAAWKTLRRSSTYCSRRRTRQRLNLSQMADKRIPPDREIVTRFVEQLRAAGFPDLQIDSWPEDDHPGQSVVEAIAGR